MHFLGNRQVNGLIIDGYTRDKATIEEMGIPQFTKGISIAPVPRNCRATAKDVNVPVSCGGAVVNPGDYLFGDIDGVMVIPEALLTMCFSRRSSIWSMSSGWSRR